MGRRSHEARRHGRALSGFHSRFDALERRAPPHRLGLFRDIDHAAPAFSDALSSNGSTPVSDSRWFERAASSRWGGNAVEDYRSPNAAPVREVLHSFALSALVEGKRFGHVRWLTDDPAIATIMHLERVRGEDALPLLTYKTRKERR